jgi:ribosomal protein L20
VSLNRKMLAELAIRDPEAFTKLVEVAKERSA